MSIIFTILMIYVFCNLIGFAVRFTWGLTKILVYIVCFPLLLIGLVFGGLMYLALPILVIAGIVCLVKKIC